MRVEQLMHSGDALPVVQLHTAMRDVIYEMSRKGLGMTSVVEKDGTLAGIITDGDLRRKMSPRQRPRAHRPRRDDVAPGHDSPDDAGRRGAGPARKPQDHVDRRGRRRAPRRRRGAPARPLANGDGLGRDSAERPEGTDELGDSLPFLGALVALLLGLAIGKAWERYKLRDGRWIDRRRARDSHHYVLGLNFLVSNQIDLAIEELSQAARVDSDALEIHLILGNVHRERGQVARAIQVHQALLQRPKLTRVEHAYILLCLGLDFKRGGFVDRALEAFNEVPRMDPTNQYALLYLQKLHEEQHQWADAHRIRKQLVALSGPDTQPRNQAILGVSRERARQRGARASAIAAVPPVTSRRRSTSIRHHRRRFSTSVTCG